MAFMEAGFGGSLGGQFRIRAQVDVAGQEQGNNRTLITYNAWLERVQSSAGNAPYNYNTTYGHTNINGYNPGRSIGGYIWPVNEVGRRYYLAQNEQYWIYHDGNGDANPVFGADFNMDNYPYITSGSVAQYVAMPHINRYANITGFNLGSITDEAINLNASADVYCSNFEFSKDGGASWQGVGGGGSQQITYRNLPSNTTFNTMVRITRGDNGLVTTSGVAPNTTKPQNNFLGIL